MRTFFLAALAFSFCATASAQATTQPAPPPVANAAVSHALFDAIRLCLPPSLTLAEFERAAGVKGWTGFAANTSGGKEWRVATRNAGPGHSVSLAAAVGTFAEAPSPARVFNCKVALRPGAAEDFRVGLGAVFGPEQTEGGFFIAENNALRPLTDQEAMVEFPASLGALRPGQRLVFFQVDQRGAVIVASIDSFEPAATPRQQ